MGSVTEGDLLWFIKINAGLDLSSAEDTPLMSIPRKHDYACVSIDTDIDHLIHAAMRQNFVPVIDGKNSFIGIVKRNALIQYCYERYAQSDNASCGGKAPPWPPIQGKPHPLEKMSRFENL